MAQAQKSGAGDSPIWDSLWNPIWYQLWSQPKTMLGGTIIQGFLSCKLSRNLTLSSSQVTCILWSPNKYWGWLYLTLNHSSQSTVSCTDLLIWPHSTEALWGGYDAGCEGHIGESVSLLKVTQLEADKQMSQDLEPGLEPGLPAPNPSSFHHTCCLHLLWAAGFFYFNFAPGIWGVKVTLRSREMA